MDKLRLRLYKPVTVTDSNKDTSLLSYGVYYGHNFYGTGLGQQEGRVHSYIETP
jgi:hypothetical protein